MGSSFLCNLKWNYIFMCVRVGVLMHPGHGADGVSRTFQVIMERALLTNVVF